MTDTLSPLEQVKAATDPFAGREVFARLASGTVDDITPADDVVMRWHGLYRHRPAEDGVFMLRLKLPGGAITAAQLDVVAAMAERYGRGAVTLTTRQDLELHWLTLASLPAVFAAFDAVGLTTVGACGDQVRNVVTCPLAGIAPDERLDTAPLAAALSSAFLGNPAFANLPRKFKIALSDCAQQCVPVAVNDVSLLASQNDDGEWGYAMLVGGGLSAQPAMAADLGAWLAPDRVVDVVRHAVAIFRDHGNRGQRGRARLKHLLAERGLPWFRAELEARLGQPLPAGAPVRLPREQGDHLGVHPQRDAGRVYLGIPVTAGRLTVAQLHGLTAVASTYGRGRVRLTHRQNVVLPDLPAARIAQIRQELTGAGLNPVDDDWSGGLVVCTGREYCMKAAAHTKSVAVRLVDELGTALPGAPLTLQISGCPNGCGQHALADIGLQGAVVKTETGPEERFDLWVGGGAADAPAFGRCIAKRLRVNELAGTIVTLWTRFRAEAADADETFSMFARRVLWTGG